MTRIVQDTNIGGWHHFSSFNRGTIYDRWPYADNQMDGFTHWSHIGGRGKIILDGDFLRLNKCTTDHERRSQVSLQLIAGGPVAIADTPKRSEISTASTPTRNFWLSMPTDRGQTSVG